MQQCMLKAYGIYGNMTTRNNSNIIQGRTVNVHKAYSIRFVKNKNEDRKHYEIEDGIVWVNVKKNRKTIFFI